MTARRAASPTTRPCSITGRQVRPAAAAGSRLRRLPRPLPRGLPAGRRRLRGRLLLPGHRPRQPVRHVVPRPRGRHRHGAARGVPGLHPLLARPPAPERHRADRLRAPRGRERHGRLPLRRGAGRGHDHGRRRARDRPQADRADRARPSTSMYQFGENDRRASDDSRQEIHDSDGLAMWRGNGEWAWRPLVNPPQLRVSYFADENPKGFGCCSATAPSTTTRTRARTTSAAPRSGSSPRVRGARAAST